AALAAVRSALDAAAVPAEAVDYVNAHGTGTRQNDEGEVRILRAVFGDRLPRIPGSSTKSPPGPWPGAAGALRAVATGPPRGRRGGGGRDGARARRLAAAADGDTARARPGVERPRPGADGGPAAAARSRPHLVVRLRRAQRDARAGTRHVSGDVVVTGIGVVS